MTTHDDGFHEIQLNGKQLVFLFMAGTAVAVVIFLLGVFVGRGVRAQASGGEALLVGQDAAASVPDVPAVATATGSGAPASAGEDLSYPDRLASADAPREPLQSAKKAADAPAPASVPSAPPSRAAADVPAEPAGDGFAIQLAALGKREEAESIVRRLAGKGYSAYLMAPASGAPAVFRVRVGKFQDRREAEAVSARLQKEEQFKPWIVR